MRGYLRFSDNFVMCGSVGDCLNIIETICNKLDQFYITTIYSENFKYLINQHNFTEMFFNGTISLAFNEDVYEHSIIDCVSTIDGDAFYLYISCLEKFEMRKCLPVNLIRSTSRINNWNITAYKLFIRLNNLKVRTLPEIIFSDNYYIKCTQDSCKKHKPSIWMDKYLKVRCFHCDSLLTYNPLNINTLDEPYDSDIVLQYI